MSESMETSRRLRHLLKSYSALWFWKNRTGNYKKACFLCKIVPCPGSNLLCYTDPFALGPNGNQEKQTEIHDI